MERLYGCMLLLYPSPYRREYGAAMRETFAQRAVKARHRGGLARLGFVGREAGGVIRGAVLERFGFPRRRRRLAVAPSPRGGSGQRGPEGRRFGRFVPEIRFAVRRLARSPGFTVAAVLTLAIGIGGNTAIFAVVNTIVLSPLPYPDADRLVSVAAEVQSIDARGIEIPIGFWLGYQSLNATFDDIGLFEYMSVNLTGEGEPERLEGIVATGSLFATLAVPPAMGRTIRQEDEAPGAPLVVVLSHRLWTRRYGADPAIIGRRILIDARAAEVVGVMPEGFAFPEPETQIWAPLTIDRAVEAPLSFSYSSIGRLADGISIERAHEDLSTATRRLPELYSNINEEFLESNGVGPWLRPYKDRLLGEVADNLWLMLGSLGFVLVIACANVANLYTVRSDARRRELAVRAALGASRSDVVRYLLSESLAIGALAGGLGLAIAVVGVRLLIVAGPTELPRLEEVSVGANELGFTLVVSMVVSATFASLPMIRLAGQRIAEQLDQVGRRSTVAGPRSGATNLLVVIQVALMLLLMVGATLFARSFFNLVRVDPGFDADGVLTFSLSLPSVAYPDDRGRAAFFHELIDYLEARPQVDAVGVARCLPLQGWCGGNQVSSPDSPLPADAFRDVASVKPVAGGYFRALGIPLVQGRGIERRDQQAGTGAAVLSQALADRLFPGMDPIGTRVYPSLEGPDDAANYYTVVGVVGTVKRLDLDEDPAEILYIAIGGTDGRFMPRLSEVNVAVRTRLDPVAWASVVREAVWSIDEDVPVAAIEPMATILRRASAQVAFTATLVGIAAAAAILLGAVGIYGVVSNTVSQRTAEFGVRMALGAQRSEVLRSVLLRGLGLALAGVVIGIGGALALARTLRAFLYEASAQDPLTLLLSASGLLLVAAIASYLPARRAAGVDPLVALRDG